MDQSVFKPVLLLLHCRWLRSVADCVQAVSHWSSWGSVLWDGASCVGHWQEQVILSFLAVRGSDDSIVFVVFFSLYAR